MVNKKEEPRRTRRDRTVPIFKDRIREVIDKAGLSGAELAKAIGLDPRTFNHVTSGNTHPDLMTLKEVAQRTDTSVDYMLGLSDSTMVGKPGVEWRDYSLIKVFSSTAAIGGDEYEGMLLPKSMCGGAKIAVRYRGSDLQPDVLPGAVVLIDTADTKEIVNGSIYLIGGSHPFLALVSRRGGDIFVAEGLAGSDVVIDGRVCLIINKT